MWSPPASHAAANTTSPGGPLLRLGKRWPFVSFFGLVILSNAAGSVFSILYNDHLIVQRYMDDAQKNVFRHVATPAYNLVAYPVCLGLVLCFLWPLLRCLPRLRAGEPIPPDEMSLCRRRLVNLPFLQVCVNSLGWVPGAVVFPLLICSLGGTHEAFAISRQFFFSFIVSAGLTVVQTFFLMEAFLVRVLYPYFFQDARPTDVQGVIRLPFGLRLWLLWMAIAVMPLVALLLIALQGRGDGTFIVATVGTLSSALIFHFARADVMQWVRQHFRATEEIARGHFDYRIPEKRPDEWGRLNDGFNDMAEALAQGQKEHRTFGQMVGRKVRDVVLKHYPEGLAGEVQEITVLFADIRGFTRRSAGEAPERVVELLNGFFTLAVRAVEARGDGHVNKFLGDGFMALFGATEPRSDHADLAVLSARDLVERLGGLNEELAELRQPPLTIGIGIHTGPAVVGCIGATLDGVDGQREVRKEFTAIGETVNVCQRVEQLTKVCGGPILVSEKTRLHLRLPVALTDLGPQALAGCDEKIGIYQVSLAHGDNGATVRYR